MKIKTIALMLLIVGLLFVAGCTASANSNYSQPPAAPNGGYVGGGCGVQGPAVVTDNIAAATTVSEALSA